MVLRSLLTNFLYRFSPTSAESPWAIEFIVVGDHETLSRFLLDSGHFSASGGRVKPKAFEPKLDEERERYETSVFRIISLGDNEIRQLADEHVAAGRGKPVLARADIEARFPRSLGLSVLADEPPERHAVILDWPGEKNERMQLQQEPASQAKLRLHS